MSNLCKYHRENRYISYDLGLTWSATGEYRKGTLIEYQSSDCPSPTSLKFQAIYSDLSTYELDCDSSTTLTRAEVTASTSPYTSMTSAVIGDCVTSIWQEAFRNCSGLTSIVIPDSVTRIVTSAFDGCKSLPSIHIPSGVTSIGAAAFFDCYALSSVTIPSGVTTIANYTFTNCSGLTSVDIPNSVISIGVEVFHRCSGLTSIDIPSGVTSIGSGACEYCSNLSGVTIPSGVTNIGENTFYNCFSISSINIPSGVTSIGYKAFKNCSGLTSITVEATTPPTLGTDVFANTNNCPIYVPSGSVTVYQSAWPTYASRIQAIPTPISLKFQATYSDLSTYSKECDGALTLISGETTEGTTDYRLMTSAIIGDCVEFIGVRAFRGFSSLTNVDISSSVTSIGNNAFRNCTSLPSIDIPSGVTSIGDAAFKNCSGLTSITVNATTPPTLGTEAFNYTNNCPIYVPSASVSAYQSAWSTYASRIQAIQT